MVLGFPSEWPVVFWRQLKCVGEVVGIRVGALVRAWFSRRQIRNAMRRRFDLQEGGTSWSGC
jgi:hypothetical protein